VTLQHEHPLICPYCGERISVVLDLSIEGQSYVEDCAVCCRPIALSYRVDDTGAIELGVRRDDD
jgi:hypothetical protein